MNSPFMCMSTINYNKNTISHNGFTLEIDPSIYPNDQAQLEHVYQAMFRYTCFLNSLPLSYPQGRYLKITGFNNYVNFKIEPVCPIYMDGQLFSTIYVEHGGRPQIISK